MGSLEAHLLEGFEGDRVVLELDGKQVGSAEGVRSSLLLGSAGSINAPAAEGRVRARVEVPTRGLSASCEVEVRGDAHLLVSIEGGALTCKPTEAPPVFM